MGGLLRDIRTAYRALRKTSGVTVVIVITIALGVGVNTAIFSVVNAFLLRPLPVPRPEQIAVLAIQQKNAPVGSSGFSYPEFTDFRGPLVEIVGVVGDGKYQTIGENAQPFFYVPLAQNFVSKRALQIRTRVAPETLIAPVKQVFLSLAPEVSIIDIETMIQLLNGALGFFAFRLAATLAGTLGGVGVILAVVGVYGVVSFAVGQRTKEIGIRVALGASGREVLTMIWIQGARLAFAGVAIGIVLAWVLTRAIGHSVTGIGTSDPVTYVSAVVLLSGVTLAACWIPARRALRVDPMVALRNE